MCLASRGLMPKKAGVEQVDAVEEGGVADVAFALASGSGS